MKKIIYFSILALTVSFLNLPGLTQTNYAQAQSNNNKYEQMNMTRNGFGSLSDNNNLYYNSSYDSTVVEPASDDLSIMPVEEEMVIMPEEEVVIMPEEDYFIDPIKYKFVYAGESFNLGEKELPVYKKIIVNDIGSIMGSFDVKLVNLKSFENTGVQSFTVVENKKYGYSIYVNLENQTISIDRNWSKWPQDEVYCMSLDCNLNKNQVVIPADDELLKITDKFLLDHGISTEFYGQPEVNRRWLENMTEEDLAWVKEIQVVYPLILDNMSIYNDSGDKEGLQVSISLKEKRVVGVWNLTTQYYEKSLYEMTENMDLVLKLAENGGMYPIYYYGEKTDIQNEVKLGTPILSLATHWQWSNNEYTQTLVPAYVFPILDKDNDLYQTSIVIKLPKEILESPEVIDNLGQPELY